ncbi:MAG: hypothetical protein JXR30_02830 [Alphaproteobacteria bacterium]|nr:hypothetical protein [Alphaproteobacteria bacterium]
MKIHCIYHRKDFDGRGSAAVVNYFYSSKNIEVIMHPYDYGDPIPDYMTWSQLDSVIMVDLCFDTAKPLKDLVEKFGDRFTLIDHHESCIQLLKKENLMSLPGIRDKRNAAVALTWKFFFPNHPTPKVVALIERSDIWKLSPEVEQFQYGLNGTPEIFNPTSALWPELFEEDKDSIQAIFNRGKAIEDYINQDYKDYAKLIHLVNFNGDIVPAVNRGLVNSLIFEQNVPNLYKKYPFVIKYVRSPQNWKMSFYTNRDDVSVLEKSKHIGGKGHVKACGTSVDTLPFTFLDKPVSFK